MITASSNYRLPRILISTGRKPILLLLALFVSLAALAQPVNIVVDPPFSTRTVGETFTITLKADFTDAIPPLGVDDIEIHLAFDNTRLQVTAMNELPVVAAFDTKVIPLEAAPFTATNASGQINYHATTASGFPVADFDILSITFTVIAGDGSATPLTLRTDPPANETRAARSGASILGTVINGNITANDVGCTTPSVVIATQPGAGICDAKPFDIILSSAPTGVAPFDLTITSPAGTATYNDISVGGVITTFTPVTENIWPADPLPVPADAIDASVTLGVKFQSSVTGFVKGVRFFSPLDVSLVPGNYTGQLWTEGGVLLASGTFTGLTPNAWQELTFDQPVLIDANTTYIASYHTIHDVYASTPGGLTAAVVNGSLTALASADAGGNGVYSYGATPSFPINSFNDANYWVDVIFSPNVYEFNLTGVTDANGCSDNGDLQTLTITSVDCSSLPYNIVVNPQVTTTAIGQTFDVVIAADLIGAALDVDDVEIHFAFDNTKLQVVSITEDPVVAAFTAKPIPLEAAPYTATNAAGQINYHATTTTGQPNTDFNILTITFEVIGGEGTTTDITLRADPPADETRIANGGNSLLADVISGVVTINDASCVTPSVTIIAPAGTLTCNSQSFDLILASTPAPTGDGPFDLTISGPGGSATYTDIPVGGVITTFTPPVEKIWPGTPAPLPPSNIDGTSGVTLGVKFRSSAPGFIKGVRFFSPNDLSTVTGDFTGQLWDENGVLLASGIFAGVTTDSWQELIFAEPVLIEANTIYVASYHANTNIYVGSPNGLVDEIVNGSLTAPASASVGGNGVYAYGATVTFPTNTVDANYWVDVIFSPNAYIFNLTGVTDANNCSNAGSLQTLAVTSVDCSVLPVTLVSLSATPRDNTVHLQWTTAYESNNKGFEVQRSTDGNHWSTIGFVAGVGNSTGTSHYNYSDQNLSSGRYYYRLKQVDLDGRFTYSAIVSVVLGSQSLYTLEQNFPNPFRGESIIRYSLPETVRVNLAVYDIYGRLVKVLVNETKDAGTHAVTFRTDNLGAGLYFYRLQAGGFSAVKKMTIQ